MTAQISDCYKYNGKDYRLVAISQAMNFKPQDYGFNPVSRSTSCWKGYWCGYEVTEKGLQLSDLFIHIEGDDYPEFNGVSIEPIEYMDCIQWKFLENGSVEEIPAKTEKHMGHRHYKNIGMPINYTGKILLGDGFMNKYYIHMGFQRAYSYKELVEFIFENGKLVDTIDHSKKAAEIRKKLDRECKDLSHPEGEDIMRFVIDSFSTDYETKAWWL